MESWRERRGDSKPAASCVTGRRSNQLNYAPDVLPRSCRMFPSVSPNSQLCPKLPESAVTGQRSNCAQADASRCDLFHFRIQPNFEAILAEFLQGKLRKRIELKFGDNPCTALPKHRLRPIRDPRTILLAAESQLLEPVQEPRVFISYRGADPSCPVA